MNENLSLSNSIELLMNKIESKEDIDSNFKKIIELMESRVTRTIFNQFLELPKDISEEEIKILGILLKACNMIYNYSGESTGLTDSEYDLLVSYYNELNSDELPITTAIATSSDVVHHTYKSLRGTLEKIYKLTEEDVLKNKSQKDFNTWLKSTEKRYFMNSGNEINLLEEEVLVMPKFDGVSCVIECDNKGNVIRALTRGDTEENEAQDISHIIKRIYSGPFKDAKHPYGIKTELMVLDDDLIKYNEIYAKDYKSTRSIASSIVNREEDDERVMYLNVIPLRYSYLIDGEETLQDISPELYNYPTLKCKLKELDKIREFSLTCKTVSPGLRCDGSVIYFTNPKVREILGREGNKNRYEVAFKFTEETAYREVLDIKFTTGLFGKLTPIVYFKPIKMKGNTVQKASLGSYGRFKDLSLAKGDVVKVVYDIIPYVIFDDSDPLCIRNGGDEFTAPDVCPDCGKPLELSETGIDLFCNNDNCVCRVKGSILNYCSKMGIDGISYATIDDFYRAGYIKNILDLYKLKNYKKELENLEGYKETKIANIINAIESKRDVEIAKLLGSIGIPGISTKKFKAITDYLSLDEILEYSKDKNREIFNVIPGMADKTSDKLINGINERYELIKGLIKEVNIIENDESSFSCVFTKVRDDELEKWIINHGGEVSDSVTKATSFVIVPNSYVESSKISKAQKYNIPIIEIDKVQDYVLNNLV